MKKLSEEESRELAEWLRRWMNPDGCEFESWVGVLEGGFEALALATWRGLAAPSSA